MKRLPCLALMLGLVLCLSACSQNDGRFSTKSSDGETLSLRLLDVWQDDAQNVLITLAGTGKGKLLDVAATPAGRWPMPKVSVRILVGEVWLESTDYPMGMFANYNVNNGLLTIRYPATTLPSQIDISGTVLSLDTLNLPGTDRAALLDAEKEEVERAAEEERLRAEADARRFEEAVLIAPKEELETSWIGAETLDAGESLYYACTGLEKAESAGVSFILSADRQSARSIRALVRNARVDLTFQTKMDYQSMLPFRLVDNRLTFESDGVYLSVTLEGDRAYGIFEYTLQGVSCGTARIEMQKMR